MLDYRQLLGLSAVLFGIGFVFQSIVPAQALPFGPSVSLGSNPVFAVQSSGSNGTLFTNSSAHPAIITDLSITQSTNSGVTCQLTFSVSNNGDSYRLFSNPAGVHGVASLNSGLQVPPGESLSFSGNGYCSGAAASGYYAH